jgi:PLP dependent protein
MNAVTFIASRLTLIQQRIATACARAGREPGSIVLLPVSKTFNSQTIRAAHVLGLRRFGENKTQEIRQKANELSDLALEWVMIGHLQTNKAKDAVKDASEVQSLDRLELAAALDRRLRQDRRTLKVLVQVKTSQEPSKYGLPPEELLTFLRTVAQDFPTLRLQGLMTMAENSSDPDKVRACFRLLRELRDQAKKQAIPGIELERLSMGISGDFEIAIEEGSTEVRVGSAIFGDRSYENT